MPEVPTSLSDLTEEQFNEVARDYGLKDTCRDTPLHLQLYKNSTKYALVEKRWSDKYGQNVYDMTFFDSNTPDPWLKDLILYSR